MQGITLIIKNVTAIRKALFRASKSRRHQNALFQNIEHKMLELKQLLDQPDIRALVDKTLFEIHQNTQEFNNHQRAQDLILDPSKAFLDFEMRLYASLGIKRKELEQFQKEARALFIKTQENEALFSSRLFPSDSNELFSVMKFQVKSAAKEIRKVKSVPRKIKKERKSKALGRFWLGVVGTSLALGNVALAIPSIGLTSSVAMASMATGVASLGAAVFDDPNLFRYLRGKQESEKNDAQS